MNLRNKFQEVLHNKAQINIGKFGINSESALDHIMKMLKREKIVKIHALKTALIEKDIKELAEEVVARTNSYLLDVRGHTFIISKNDIKKELKKTK